MERRARVKHRKYDADAKAVEGVFAALVVDSFGSLNKEFVSLVDEIEETATRGLGRSLPTRMTRATFLALFGSQWQGDNAAIIAQVARLVPAAAAAGHSRGMALCTCSHFCTPFSLP